MAGSIEELASNAKGLAFAAFAPLSEIERVAGCSAAEAYALQEEAALDWMRLNRAIDQARTQLRPTGRLA